MNCPKCNAPIEDGMVFCSNCGEIVSAEREAVANEAQQQYNENVYGEMPQNNVYGNYQQESYQQNYSAHYNDPYRYNQQNMYEVPHERIPTKGEYFLWLFVLPLASIVPLLYPILVIVFACGKSYPARANFFKAFLIFWLVVAIVTVVLVVIAIILMTVFGVSFSAVASDFGSYMPW